MIKVKSIFLAILLIATPTIGALAAPPVDDDLLTIGDPAPALDIEHWLSDGDGKFPHVETFEKGKIYVVEFWATWCGPCIASMPHISKLQEEYADRGVQIISVSDEELDTVKEFLERKVPDADDKTFGELTRNYSLTTDPDNSVYEDYMEASAQDGIPTAFIVGKDGKIEWIGHPMEMDKPLDQVVQGTWDREAFAKSVREEQIVNKRMKEAIRLLRSGEMEDGLEIVEELVETTSNSELKNRLQLFRISVLMATGGEQLVDVFGQVAKANQSNPNLLNELAWGIVEVADSGREVEPELVQAARQAIDWAVEKEPRNAAILDTQAHIAYLQGNLDEAIEIQTKAVCDRARWKTAWKSWKSWSKPPRIPN